MTRLIDVMAEIHRRELAGEDDRIRRAAETFHAEDAPRFADVRTGGNMDKPVWRPSVAVWVAASWPLWAWAAAAVVQYFGRMW